MVMKVEYQLINFLQIKNFNYSTELRDVGPTMKLTDKEFFNYMYITEFKTRKRCMLNTSKKT